jgi:hypothetical protein
MSCSSSAAAMRRRVRRAAPQTGHTMPGGTESGRGVCLVNGERDIHAQADGGIMSTRCPPPRRARSAGVEAVMVT